MVALTSTTSQRVGLLILRIATAGLIFWWGLIKGLGTPAGAAVSDRYYGGLFTIDTLLIVFGWFQVALAVLIILGPYRPSS